MQELNNSLNQLKNDLYLVLNNLDELNEDNFNNKMQDVNSLIKQIEKKRVYIKKKFSAESLHGKSDLLHTAVKQIVAKFDGIIEEKKEQQIEISSELNKLVNKKKLINYQR